MNKTARIWLITAASLLLIAGIIFGSVMTVLKWDFKKLSTVKYETNSYEINENYSNISVKTKTADITFMPSQNGETSVICLEEKKLKHTVTVENGTLIIDNTDNRKWYDYIGINIGNPKITVYIPEGEYGALSVKSNTGDVKIPEEFKFETMEISGSTGDIYCKASVLGTVNVKLSTGHIDLEDISVGEATLSVSTGDINLKSVKCDGKLEANVSTGKTKLTDTLCNNLLAKGTTGNIALYNVIAEDNFYITRSTGDVKFENSDAKEIIVKTNTGNVKGTLLSSKVFITETSTGDIKVPKTASGGKCEISTDTGDINIAIN